MFLNDVDKYFAIPLFFCESNIEEANNELMSRIGDDEKAIPILLLPKSNNELEKTVLELKYNILKEHFTLHSPETYLERADLYEYLSETNGYLLFTYFYKRYYYSCKKIEIKFSKYENYYCTFRT